jgi:hypothetical protein
VVYTQKYAMEYYSGLKAKDILTFARVGINLKHIVLSKENQAEKNCYFYYYVNKNHTCFY